MNARRLTAGFAAVVVAVLLGACAPEPDGPAESPSPPPPATPSPPMPSPVPPTPSPGPEQTITGEVVEGVERNCVLLRTDTEEFLLIGAQVEDLRSGSTATVRGHADPDLMTTCLQGVPFLVDEVLDR